MRIRFFQETDKNKIGALIGTAFCDEENKLIMKLALELVRETTSPSVKSLVAEVNEGVIGIWPSVQYS